MQRRRGHALRGRRGANCGTFMLIDNVNITRVGDRGSQGFSKEKHILNVHANSKRIYMHT